MHPDQLVLTDAAAAALIEHSVPEAAGMQVRRLDSPGTVNALYRVGDGLVARFPLLPTEIDEVRREADALRELTQHSPVPVPRPVRIVDATDGFPSAWSVLTWVEGSPADQHDGPGADLAHDLGDLILALRAAPLRGRSFDGKGRGGDLRDSDDWVARCFARSRHLFDAEAAGRLWAALRTVPHPGIEVMSHRDLTPPNLLIDESGRLCGVLDGGSFGPADPALDLVCAWHLFVADDRAILREAVGASDAEWRRGAAWALQQAAGLGWYYEKTNPVMSAIGVRTIERLLSDEELGA